MRTPCQKRARWFFAIPCMIAVLALYAPLAGSAWYCYSRACCSAGVCPMHSHEHSSRAPSGHAMDCGHEMPSIFTCSISCCHNSDRPAIAPVLFLLPPPNTVRPPLDQKSAITFFLPPIDSHSIEPQSPPPRLFALAA